MSGVVVVNGHPRIGSRTSSLADAVGSALADNNGLAVVSVGGLGADLLAGDAPATVGALELMRKADLLVVATPTYKGAYTGILKVLFDHLPARALEGIEAVTVVTAGIQPQADAAEGHLRALLAELGALLTRPGLTVVEKDLDRAADIAARYAAA